MAFDLTFCYEEAMLPPEPRARTFTSANRNRGSLGHCIWTHRPSINGRSILRIVSDAAGCVPARSGYLSLDVPAVAGFAVGPERGRGIESLSTVLGDEYDDDGGFGWW
ncbi:hypothetical protein VTO73DRAFT_1695 [Trametes versicolor]